MDEQEALLRLAAELHRHDWPAQIRPRGGGLALTVTNPDETGLNETVVCVADGDGELIFRIAGGQDLGSVSDVTTVTSKLLHLLRGVGS